MSESSGRPECPRPEDAEAIPKWARAYAQNRSLGVVVFMIISLVLYAAIGGSSYLAGVAYRSGNMPLLCVSVAVLLAALAATVYLSVPKWGGKLLERVVRRLYAKEGNVAFSVPGEGRKVWARVLGGCFGTCVLASVAAGFVFDFPHEYMQPISALYVVPFLVGLWFLMRPMAGYAALLWPGLYAAHAILIVAGAPILFTGPAEGLNMLAPIAGYGLLAGLVGHLWSRVALGRLRRLAHTGQADADSSERRSEA